MPSERVERIVDGLIGTTGDAALQDEIMELTPSELADLDSMIFECDGCGWWCPVEEQADDDMCTDCVEAMG